MVLAYYDAPDRIQEALWYRLSDVQPGWKVLYGTQGQVDTWRFMLKASFGTTDYNNLEIGEGCTIPESDWQ